MEEEDKKEYVQRYHSRLAEHGYSPKTLGWGKTGRQETRFYILSKLILKYPTASVLDIGCGFADFYEYLKGSGWQGEYCGLDIVPKVLEMAKSRHPEVDFVLGDFSDKEVSETLGKFDFVVASGVFNAILKKSSNEDHIESCLKKMLELANKAVCVDFMSTNVDFKHEEAWHTDPAWLATTAAKISPRFSMSHDYMPYEFALTLHKDAQISENNVFAAVEKTVGSLDRPVFKGE